MQLDLLNKHFDKLQIKYGAKNLKAIYGAGCIKQPDICFIFMNPTARNITCKDNWKSIRAPWIGTKNVWKLFYKLNLLDKNIYQEICIKKPLEWDEGFTLKVYNNIRDNKIYITNLGKCTQEDARPLSNNVFKEYLGLLEKEIDMIKPKNIICFGNQVSSIFLNQKISVSKCRGKVFKKIINDNEYRVYASYYPVGQGMRNINIVLEDLPKFIKSSL